MQVALIISLTLILLTWRIGWAPNNASRWQMGFNLAFKGLIFQLMHTIYTLQKALKFTLKTLNICPHMFRSLFKTILRGLVDCTLPSETLSFHDKVSLSKEHQTHTRAHTQTEWDDIWPQTAQFYNERISTDPILVTWQSTVYEPPEDGFIKRPKHVGASVKCF